MSYSSEAQSLANSFASSQCNSSLSLTYSNQFKGMVPSRIKGTVVKLSSYITWYCGETCKVQGFKTRATEPACVGLWPKYMPTLERGSHFGDLFSRAESVSTKTGQPHGCRLVIKGLTVEPQNRCSGVRPSLLM